MTLFEAFGYYFIRLVLYAAVAAGGIAIGIRLRKSKNAKKTNKEQVIGDEIWQLELVRDQEIY